MSPEQRKTTILALIGFAAIGLYTLLALQYPVGASLNTPRASWIRLIANPSRLSLAYHMAIYLGLSLLTMAAMRLLMPTPDAPPALPATRQTRLGVVVVVWLACSVVLLGVAPGGESHDIFDYIFRGRMQTELGANPLADLPKQFSSAPYYRYLAWHSHVDTYGPLWELTSAATTTGVARALQLVGIWGTDSPVCPQPLRSCRILLGYLAGYRLLAIALTGVSAWLIFGMVRRHQPHWAAAALAAWLWNPLVLVSSAVGAHNDAFMVVLLLLMLWLLQRHRWLWALLALVLAAHVKLTALIVTPVVGLWLVRRCGWWRATVTSMSAVGLGALLSWLLYAPYAGWGTLPRMLSERTIFLANSPWRVLYDLLYTHFNWRYASVWRLTVQLPTWLFVVGAIMLAFWLLEFRPRRWKTTPTPDWDDDRQLWRAVTAVSLLYLLVGSFWFQHWYVVWVLAPAALRPGSRLTRRLLPWLSFGALSANVFGDFALAELPKAASKTGVLALIVAVIWLPMLIASLWRSGARRP